MVATNLHGLWWLRHCTSKGNWWQIPVPFLEQVVQSNVLAGDQVNELRDLELIIDSFLLSKVEGGLKKPLVLGGLS